MKMRKLLPLVLLAVGSLFLLTSCDALLDAIFPNSQIFVDVRVYGGSYTTDWIQSYNFNQISGIVTVILVDQRNGDTTSANSYFTSADPTFIHYGFNFTGLKDHTYLVTAYYVSYNYADPLPQSYLVTPNDATGHSASLTVTF
jgi:hypothetical protein